jgi:Protein of unknown function (DUF4232)
VRRDTVKRMRRTASQAAAAWVGVILVAGCASSGPGTMVTADRASDGCPVSALLVRLIHGGAAGPIAGGYLSFNNISNRPCTLSGWPSVRAIRASGASLSGENVRSTQFGPHVRGVPKVVLKPGHHADAVFVGTTAAGPGRSTCGQSYTHLRVAPPGSRKTVVLSAWLPELGAYLPACSRIEVSMIVPSSGLYHG